MEFALKLRNQARPAALIVMIVRAANESGYNPRDRRHG
jgi:hypothetical protein